VTTLDFYPLLKTTHVTCAALSIVLFALRGGWMLLDSAHLQQRWVRVLPHLIDSVLLASALALSAAIAQYPGVDEWLTAKVVLLIVYIMLGMVALKWGRGKGIKAAAWVLAMLVFAAIVLIALRKPMLG